MARKKRVEEHVNHERWLVSYADFITLLFAFFVVMYSMSSVNEGKYRVLSDSMAAAFSPTTRSLNPIQIGTLVRSAASAVPSINEMPRPISIVPVMISNPAIFDESLLPGREAERSLGNSSMQIEQIANDIQDAFQELINADQVLIRRNPLWLEMEFNSSMLFSSGRAELSLQAEQELSRLSILLDEYPNRVNVEGFTDNLPIQSAVFPSNWELSSARAGAVVRLFEQYGVEPERMSSVGYGEFRPKVPNDSEIGRANNRRVVVVVMANIEGEAFDQGSVFENLELLRQRQASQSQ